MKRLYSIERGNNWFALTFGPGITYSGSSRRFTAERTIHWYVRMDQLWGRG